MLLASPIFLALNSHTIFLNKLLQTSKLAALTKGFSGAEIVSICRESALLAIEESDRNPDIVPIIRMTHIQSSISGTKKQITPSMLEFYDSFGKSKNVTRQ